MRRGAVGLLIGVGALVATLPAAAYVQYTTLGGFPVRWTTDNVTFSLALPLPVGFDQDRTMGALEQAFSRWTGLTCAPMTISGPEPGTCDGPDPGDDLNCIGWSTEVGSWTEKPWLVAVTFVSHDTASGEILDTDMQFNIRSAAKASADEGFDYTDSPGCDPDIDLYDLQATATHEMGHVLGLDHSSDMFATMNKVTFPGDCKKRTLHDDDVQGYCATYTWEPPPSEPGDDTPDCSGGAGAFPGWAWLILALAWARGRRTTRRVAPGPRPSPAR